MSDYTPPAWPLGCLVVLAVIGFVAIVGWVLEKLWQVFG